MEKAAADVVIFGGGIAGLWLLARLRASGLSAILFESNAIGGGQTHKSQGILHGGMKYALQGILTPETSSMAQIPDYWQECLNGRGEVDLSGVPILSTHQYLWAPTKLTSKIAGFLASAALESKVNALKKANYPSIFQHPAFKGEVFALNEMVLDVHVLLREMVKTNQDVIFKAEPVCEQELQLTPEGNLRSVTVYLSGKSIEVTAQQFIFAAGVGNEVILRKLNKADIAMQRRPLHMVLAKTDFKHPLYAHCLSLSARPRITITTHKTHDDHYVWYLGGLLAEEGVKRDRCAQIQAAKAELSSLFSWLDFSNTEWAAFMIDRAEPWQKDGLKPESSCFKSINNMLIAWPVKLALAPQLAADVLSYLQKENISPQLLDLRELRAWPMPPLAIPMWEDIFCKSVA